MNQTRIISRLVCLSLAIIFVSSIRVHAEDNPVDTNRQLAEKLWEESIQAKGGRERLHSIETFVISSVIDTNTARWRGDTQTERLYVMPRKAWLYEYTEDFDVSLEGTVINMDRDLCLVTLAPIGPALSVPGISLCVPTIWSERLIQDPAIYLMETKWVRPVPLRTRTDGKGKKQKDVIETQVGEMRIDYYLDRKTHLPVKIIADDFNGITKSSMELMVRFEDYANVDGIQMPRVVIREPIGRIYVERRDTERAKYKFNVAYDEKILNQPMSRKAKPNDWRK